MIVLVLAMSFSLIESFQTSSGHTGVLACAVPITAAEKVSLSH
jgi:hypothetical protein